MTDSPWRYGSPTPQYAADSVSTPQTDFLTCSNCGEDIAEGEEAVHLFIGRAGRGVKSGLPMVVDSKLLSDQETTTANLHLWCVSEFAGIVVYDDQYYSHNPPDDDEDGFVCATCDALVQDSDKFCYKCGSELSEA